MDRASLAQKIQAREQFLAEVVPAIEKLTREAGRQIYSHQSSCHTNTKHLLLNCRGFSFLADLGQSMMGGNSIDVWHHPETLHKEKPTKGATLSVYWPGGDFSKDSCEVYAFAETTPTKNWQESLLGVAREHEAIIQESRSESERNRQSAEENRAEEKRLEERAKKLLIST